MELPTTRKVFLIHTASAGTALAVGGGVAEAHRVRPRPRRRAASAESRLTLSETLTLAAWCDRLAPGARAAGVGDFVNAQLAKHPDDALLGIRYFGWPPPWRPFYRDGIAALDDASAGAFGVPFRRLSGPQADELHARLLAGEVEWGAAAPFFLFYLVTRSDAVDVVYGTPRGYARIGVPYVPNAPWARPRRRW
jgi:hypothetical protein